MPTENNLTMLDKNIKGDIYTGYQWIIKSDEYARHSIMFTDCVIENATAKAMSFKYKVDEKLIDFGWVPKSLVKAIQDPKGITIFIPSWFCKKKFDELDKQRTIVPDRKLYAKCRCGKVKVYGHPDEHPEGIWECHSCGWYYEWGT